MQAVDNMMTNYEQVNGQVTFILFIRYLYGYTFTLYTESGVGCINRYYINMYNITRRTDKLEITIYLRY